MSDDPKVLFALSLRFILLGLALANIGFTLVMYHHFRDTRGLRSTVSSLALLGGVLMFFGLSPTLRDEWPEFLPIMRVVSTTGLLMLLAGLIFIVSTWIKR